jgi:hypothetical protein
MHVRRARTHVAIVVLVIAFLIVGAPLFAQVRTNTPGTVFEPEGPRGAVAMEDVGSGRRFRGKAHQLVTLRGVLQMPRPDAAEPRLQRLVVHFRTSVGPRLQIVELRNGSSTPFRIDTDLRGDYATSETLKPPRAANAWVISPITVGSATVIRLAVQFSGGIDSAVDPGEFVLIGVGAEFPRKWSTSTTATERMPERAVPAAPSGRGPAPTVPTRAVAPNQVIYALAENNELVWFGHSGRENGTVAWAAPQPKVIATRWGFKQVFSGGDGIIYAITSSGDLLWYRHDGQADGSIRWSEPRKVGAGWNFPHVFSGGGGVIYAVTAKGELWWFRHEGHGDGTERWTNKEGGMWMLEGWGTYKHVFYGGDGVIYAVSADDRLLWYHHEGHDDGTVRWTSEEGRTVGTGWGFKRLFSAGDGVIYGVNANNELLWYRHDGRDDGTPRWAAPQGKTVGTGWNFKEIFSGF